MRLGLRRAAAALLLLAGCGSGGETETPTAATAPTAAAPTATRPAATPSPAPRAATDAAPACEPDAPQSPCPIVGRWRIVKVYDPALAAPLADELRMAGATFTVTGNADGPGAIRWDGPDTGQFDIRDVCAGPFLSAVAEPRSDGSRATLTKALRAFGVSENADAARHLGCDQGAWATPSDPGGEWFGLFLPLGRRLVFEWYEERFVLAERIG